MAARASEYWAQDLAMRLVDHLRSNDNVVERADLLKRGLPRSVIDRKLASLEWLSLARGVYLTSGVPPTGRQLGRAALLVAGSPARLSGTHAMQLFGVRIPLSAQVTVLIPNSHKVTANALVSPIRVRELPPGFKRGGLPCVPLARASLDACRFARSLDDVRALLSAPVQQRRCSAPDLVEQARMVGRLDRLVREGVHEVVAGIRSVPEGRLRKLILGSSLPEPLWNPILTLPDGRGPISPDAYWQDAGVAAEVESQQWHFAPADWRRTVARIARMSASGILVVQTVPSRLDSDPRGILDEFTRARAAGLARPELNVRVRRAM